MYIKHFEELNINELYSIINLRERIFVVEQECYYLDADNKDKKSWHLLLKEDHNLVAYLRILPPGLSYEYPSIGRVVVDDKCRDKGYGRVIMQKAIDFISSKYPNDSIKIGAQTYLNKFYTSLGFENIGEKYLEDGIEHVDMLLKHKL